MKIKKGLKIFGATLGAVAVTMTVVCCYGPGPNFNPEDDIGYRKPLTEQGFDVSSDSSDVLSDISNGEN